MTTAVRKAVCYTISALALGGAGAYLLFGENDGLGIASVLLAAVVSRVLVLNIAEQHPEPEDRAENRDADHR